MNVNLPVLAPSILAADFSRLGEQIKSCTDEEIQWIHCDIMDGHFVPNISFGPGIVGTVRDIAPEAFLDVHLMIENPNNFIDDFADAGADLISVHYETCPHLHRTVENIKNNGCMAGVVINPATPVHLLEPILPEIDLTLIMSVNPGFGGQSFIRSSYQKIRKLYQLREESGLSFLIEVDGGVGTQNAGELVSNGVDVLVAGSKVFKTDDISKSIASLLKAARAGSNRVV
ncbi:ribulose-phosphate 3-epimerase [Rhodohalobacter sulfatireducens]|uniref:Ribulose-phosphate 3-epimerase n=1 Tax=Rhodohalobacter sulfatireducens TaxID=2911366 RepID=A0ABS9KH86_9BACT|nr:ribulose-phosphate 3-epimerase [Rhodohalobacter sulfatireducens]MCG2590167.1 ribulose-phosphate 3-epimerase [Rhodohalobacter sulfatireducens]